MKKSKRRKTPHRKPKRANRGSKTKHSTALTVSQAPAPIVIAPPAQIVSAVPTVLATAANLEKVRRFVSKCMNVDLQRELAKLAKRDLTDDARAKAEAAIREKFEIDWGTIPGVDKPFLKQPGAEKFCFWLNLRPKYFKVETEIGAGHLEMVCHVIVYAKKTSEEVFEGPACSCTSMESNFRFRWMERDTSKTPAPTQIEADRLKIQGLGRWRKKSIWAHGRYVKDEWVWWDKIENPNVWDERNKVRQMGEKRALVKCVRNMGALSEIFVSDPSEWDIPDEEAGSPEQDRDYTPSGRKIVRDEPKAIDCTYCGKTDAPAGCAEANCPIRKDPNYLKLTPEQKEIVDRQIREHTRKAEGKPAPAAAAQEPAYDRAMTYLWIESDQEAIVDGNDGIKRELQQILAKHTRPPKFQIRVNGDELDALTFELKERKVKFTRVYPKV
jgi:hypothetical protein